MQKCEGMKEKFIIMEYPGLRITEVNEVTCSCIKSCNVLHGRCNVEM